MVNSAIILLTYNHQEFIIEALDGIRNQTVKSEEVIIADDCSTDNTQNIILEYVEKHHLKSSWQLIFNKENLGINLNLKNAIKSTNASIIIPMAGDDISLNNRTEVSLKLFAINPKLHIVTTSVIKINYSGEIIGKHLYGNNIKCDIESTIKNGSTGVLAVGQAWKRSIFEKFGWLPSDIPNEDDQISFRGLLDNGIFCSSIITTKYRIHDNSASAWLQKKQNKSEYYNRFLKDMLIRKKQMEYWRDTINICNREDKHSLLKLLQSKIEFYLILSKLDSYNLFQRTTFLVKFFYQIGVKEKVYIFFGKSGVLLWRWLRLTLNK